MSIENELHLIQEFAASGELAAIFTTFMEDSQAITPDEDNATVEKVTPEKFISMLSKVQKKLMHIGIAVVIIMVPLAIYTNTNFANTPYGESNWEDLKNGNAIVNVIALAGIGFLFYAWRLYGKFIKGFRNIKKSPIFWKYNNGNFFILNNHGIIYYNAVPQEQIVKTTFEGITWTGEDVKAIIEDAAKNELSIGSFLPTLKFRRTSNFVDPYIPLSKKDELSIIFCDLELLKFIIVAVKVDNETSTIRIPVPPEVLFEKQEFIFVENYFYSYAKCKVQLFYVDKTEMDNLNAKN